MKEKLTGRNILIAGVVVAFIAIVAFDPGFFSAADRPATSGTGGRTAVVPTATVAERATATTRPELRSALESVLGDSNRFDRNRLTSYRNRADEGTLEITWAIDDTFSSLMAETVRKDIYDILNAVDESGINYERVIVAGTFAMQDAYGNASEEVVVQATYPRANVRRINWANFRPRDVFGIATGVYVHDSFR